VKIIYSPLYEVDIGPHVYPTTKYRLVNDELSRRRAGSTCPPSAITVIEPEPASWQDLALVHTADYLDKVRNGTLSPDEIRELELPWSPQMVDGFRLMAGGTVTGARLAVDSDRIVAHLGGGFHHAFANHGEGFCLFNDVAVAIRVLQRDRALERAAVVDCDVHHGNGTAFIFDGDSSVFTFSIHQQHNYPMFKPRGSLDINLRDGTGDREYLDKLQGGLVRTLASSPQIVFYLAGADPYEGDQLGGLALTFDGLRRRDRMVLDAVRKADVPIVITLAGGYARRVEDTVAIHVATIEEAVKS
jgi:acetoin utilization deacetylase AcuC-like enzyme